VDEQDDTVIDLAAYLRRKEAEAEDEESSSTFTLWGGEGERSRFALPLWRAAYLAGGRRSALLWLRKEVPEEEPEPLIVLDLRAEQARLDFTPSSVIGRTRPSRARSRRTAVAFRSTSAKTRTGSGI
jgi:hypothetical protein